MLFSTRRLAARLSTTAAAAAPAAPEFHVDAFGRRLLLNSSTGRVPFYYDPDTFDSYEQVVKSTAKPQYSTSWEDGNFPGWVQFMDSTGKRPYYVDLANPITQVTWAPPGEPELDIFRKEYEDMARPLQSIVTLVPASFSRRTAAVVCDVGVSLGVGLVFGSLVFVDLGKMMEAGQGFGFATLVAFLARDAMNLKERGTRSLGKQLCKLEIVKSGDGGTLPTRWSTAFRQITLPLYILGPQLFFPQFVLLPILELGLVLFTPKRMRLADWLAGTVVVEEQPDRAQRFAEKCKREDEDDAKD